MEILKQKLENIKPDVVITEKEITFKVLEVLKEQGVAAISNMSEAQLLNLVEYSDKFFITPFYYGLLQDPSSEDPLL